MWAENKLGRKIKVTVNLKTGCFGNIDSALIFYSAPIDSVLKISVILFFLLNINIRSSIVYLLF